MPHALVRLAAIALALGTASLPSPGPLRAHLSAEVPGLDGLAHRPLLVMGSGGNGSYDCVPGLPRELVPNTRGLFALYEDGDVIYTRTTADGCEVVEAHLPPATVPARLAAIIDDDAITLPHVRYVWAHPHAPGASILWRRGTVWHRARASGVTRFGDVISGEERPDPAFLRALRAMATFEAAGAERWQPREIGIWLSPGAYYGPELQHPVPWPSSVPEPALPLSSELPNVFVDAKHAPALRALFRDAQMVFVVLGGTSWRLNLFDDVLPAHGYLASVNRALDRLEPPLGSD
jgi:hypothetical protein